MLKANIKLIFIIIVGLGHFSFEANGQSGQWINMTPKPGPAPRENHAIAYDSVRGVTVLYGGEDSGHNALSDMWEWDGISWKQIYSSASPSARVLHAISYDSNRRRLVLFGGTDFNANLSDTWEWDGVVWQKKDSFTLSFGYVWPCDGI